MAKSRNTILGILLCGLFALCLTFGIMGFTTSQTAYAVGAPGTIIISFDSTAGYISVGETPVHESTYTINFNNVSDDEIDLLNSGNTIEFQDLLNLVSVTAYANEGYRFVSWQINGVNAAIRCNSGTTVTAVFEVVKSANSITDLTLDDWTYGDTPSTPSATATYGEIVYTYSDEEDGEYTSEVPTNAGFYYVKAEVAESDTYQGAVATKEFEIKKRTLNVTIADKTSVYYDDIVELTAVCDGLAYDDKASDLFVLETDATKTSDAGNYLIYPIDSNGLLSHNYDINYIGTYIQNKINMGCSTYTISKREIEIIWSENEFTYTGEDLYDEVSASYKLLGDEIYPIDDSYIQIKNNKYIIGSSMSGYTSYDFIEAGDYTANLTTAGWNAVKNAAGNNYKLPTKRTKVYSIAQATGEITVDTTTITKNYNETITLPTAESNFGEVTCDKTLADLVNAGEYTVTYTLEGTDNYTGDVKTVKVVINRAANEITTLTLDSWIFGDTPSVLTAESKFGDVEIMYSKADPINFSIEEMPTEIGKYIVKAYVFGDDNYESTMKELEFSVYQRAGDVSIVDENDEVIDDPDVKIISSEKGIDPDAILVVKIVNVDKTDASSTKTALKKADKVAKNEKIYGIYDAKLLANGVEIQPNGNITIKMLVPEELIGKTFKLYHIHNGEIIKVNYTDVDAEGFITFETDKLSQFAFVAEGNDAGKTNLFNAGEIFGLVVCSLLLLLIILYLIGYFFLYRKGKLDDKKIRVIYKGLPRGNKGIEKNADSKTSAKIANGETAESDKDNE